MGPANRGHSLGPSEPGPFAWATRTGAICLGPTNKFFCVKGPRVAYLPPAIKFFGAFAPAGQGPRDGSWPPTTIFFVFSRRPGKGPGLPHGPQQQNFCVFAQAKPLPNNKMFVCVCTHMCVSRVHIHHTYIWHTHTHTHTHTHKHTYKLKKPQALNPKAQTLKP